MLGQFGAEQPFVSRGAPAAMVAADLKCRRPGACREEPNDPGRDHDQRKGHPEEKDADKSQSGQHQHRPALQRAAADPLHRLQHDRQHRRFQAEKQGRDDRHAAIGGVDDAERHD